MADILGIGNAAGSVVKEVGAAVDKLFTSDDERMEHAYKLEKLNQEIALAQNDTNKEESKHWAIFVAGWRPFIGWICGFALAYNFILYNVIAWTVMNFVEAPVLPPTLDLTDLIAILVGMLGLSYTRTQEKFKGVAYTTHGNKPIS